MAKKQATKNKKGSFLKKVLVAFVLIALIGGGIGVFIAYRTIYKPNVFLDGKNSAFIYIRTGSTFKDVGDMLYDNGIIVNKTGFEWLAEQKCYKNNIKPGKYRINQKMGNNELVNLLKAGLQEKVTFTLNNVRTKEQLASRIGGKLEADSIELVTLLNNERFLQKYGLDSETILSMFIPASYSFYWNTSCLQFCDSMAVQYKKFWTEMRKQKAKNLGLTQTEVYILATIVQHESYIDKEKPLIAGVYLNRLRKRMPLQADPTLIWASGDFTIQRVLNEHKELDSPYNTYKYTGLPPGPIGLASVSSLDAVLNYKKHDYIYFCAKEDFSGCSNFAKTYEQHQLNARKYQSALDKRNIRR